MGFSIFRERLRLCNARRWWKRKKKAAFLHFSSILSKVERRIKKKEHPGRDIRPIFFFSNLNPLGPLLGIGLDTFFSTIFFLLLTIRIYSRSRSRRREREERRDFSKDGSGSNWRVDVEEEGGSRREKGNDENFVLVEREKECSSEFLASSTSGGPRWCVPWVPIV